MAASHGENPARSPLRTESQAEITAEHEAAHALAYIHFGLNFTYVSATEGYTAVPRRTIEAWQSAVVALAGPCVDLRYQVARLGEPEALEAVLDAWLDAAEYDEERDHDVFHAHGYLIAALPVALALVVDNTDLIHDLGRAVLRSDPLSYNAAMKVVGGRRPVLSAPSVKRSLAMLADYGDRLRAIDAAASIGSGQRIPRLSGDTPECHQDN